MGPDVPEGPGYLLDSHLAIDQANRLARFESYNKHLYRPNTYLHKWWARRCGSTFRYILKALSDDSSSQDYYSPGGLEGKIVLDPMLGGGTTLHEAIRLGANVVGVDLDPIPILQARASLSAIPLQKLEDAFAHFSSELRKRVGPLFRCTCPDCHQVTDSKYFLYGAVRQCSCEGALLLDSLVLREQTDGTLWQACAPSGKRLFAKNIRVCPDCHGRFKLDSTIPFYQRYEPVAVVGDCPEHGLFFHKFDDLDRANLEQANLSRPQLDTNSLLIESGPKSDSLIRNGIRSYDDLFSSRQLIYLENAIELVAEFSGLIRTFLALLISTSLDFNSLLCGYKGGSIHRPGAIRHVFAHHAYSFPYTALENNPVFPNGGSGTLCKLFHDRIRRARLWAASPRERIFERPRMQTVRIPEVDTGQEVTNQSDLQRGTHRFLLVRGSATSLSLFDNSVDFVVTDPPYFDSVQYSDLAAFFHVWLDKLIPEALDWRVDTSQSAVLTKIEDLDKYINILSGIFAECQRVMKKNIGRLVFTYHHWKPEAWTSLAIALKRSRFRLLNRYVVQAENPASVHIVNQRALRHDAILVLDSPQPYKSRGWPEPKSVERGESAQFCQDCGSVLGWMLDQELAECDIETGWVRLFSKQPGIEKSPDPTP